MTENDLDLQDDSHQRQLMPPPSRRPRQLMSRFLSPSPRGGGVRIFPGSSRRKRLPANFEHVDFADKAVAGPIMMQRAREVARVHGRLVEEGNGYRSHVKEAGSTMFRLKTRYCLDHDESENYDITIIHDGSVCLRGSLIVRSGQREPEIKIQKWSRRKWQKYFLSAFPIFED